MTDALGERLTMLKARSEASRQKHKADVAYVQKHYPELARFLIEMTREFGRLEYRVTLKK